MKVLAIESSCDETAAAVVVDGRDVRSNIISTQIDVHTLYGGVVPEIASRAHLERICMVIKKALRDAGEAEDGSTVDAVAVTYGPGLVGPLLVGLSAAKGLAWGAGKPFVGVHHISGHISANYIENKDLEPPFLCLVVSGGHTHLVRVLDYCKYEILGRTVDDAAGEAFDKVARAIGLGYPGGPKIEAEARGGDPEAIPFPVAKVRGSDYDFSFSGLKSAVLNFLNETAMKSGRNAESGHGSTEEKTQNDGLYDESTGLIYGKVKRTDLAASFQKAVVDALVSHTMEAVAEFGETRIAIAGGVASNGAFRAAMEEECSKRGIAFFRPSPILCTDNAAMIGADGYYRLLSGHRDGWDLNAVPGLML